MFQTHTLSLVNITASLLSGFLALVSSPKFILHGIQSKLSEPRSDMETLLLENFNSFPLRSTSSDIPHPRRQGPAYQNPLLSSPASHHHFCSSHTDVAWPVPLAYRALSHFLTVPAPILFHPLPSQDFQLIPHMAILHEGFPDCFQVWIWYPTFVISRYALCLTIVLLLCPCQEDRAWICLVFYIHHGQHSIRTHSSDLKIFWKNEWMNVPPAPMFPGLKVSSCLLITPQVTKVHLVLMPSRRLSSYWWGPPTTWGNLFIHLFHQQTFVPGMFWVLE